MPDTRLGPMLTAPDRSACHTPFGARSQYPSWRERAALAVSKARVALNRLASYLHTLERLSPA